MLRDHFSWWLVPSRYCDGLYNLFYCPCYFSPAVPEKECRLLAVWIRIFWFIRPPPLLPFFRWGWSATPAITELAHSLASAAALTHICLGSRRAAGSTRRQILTRPEPEAYLPLLQGAPKCRGGLVSRHAAPRASRYHLQESPVPAYLCPSAGVSRKEEHRRDD